MFNDIWKSTTLTLITAATAVVTCGMQPSTSMDGAAIRNLESSVVLAMTGPARLSAIKPFAAPMIQASEGRFGDGASVEPRSMVIWSR